MTGFIDLVAFAKELPPRHRKLKDEILKLRDAQSARSDLDLAYDMVGSLEALWGAAANGPVGELAENCWVSLLYSAIILYARGTKTTSKHRRSFDFRSKFDDEQKAAHDLLCDLRDDAVAHYGPGGVYRGAAWQIDGVYLAEVPGGIQVMAGSRRLVQSKQLLATLTRQVHRALMLADRNVQQCNERVKQSLHDLILGDDDIVSLLKAHQGDPVAFFGTKEAAAEALDGIRAGRVRGSSQS